jgi:hypothetical protein
MTHLEVVAVGHNGLIRLLEFYFVYDPYVMDDTPDLQSGTRGSSIISPKETKGYPGSGRNWYILQST